MEAALTEILSTAIRSFVNNDLQLAARVEPLEELIDNLCDEMKLHHVDRLQKDFAPWDRALCSMIY